MRVLNVRMLNNFAKISNFRLICSDFHRVYGKKQIGQILFVFVYDFTSTDDLTCFSNETSPNQNTILENKLK